MPAHFHIRAMPHFRSHVYEKPTIRPSANEDGVDRSQYTHRLDIASRERKSQRPTIGSSTFFFEDNRLNDNRKAQPKDHCLESPAIVNDHHQTSSRNLGL